MPVWLANLWIWVQANPWTTLAIVAYLLVNLAPRPHPAEHTGWARTFWLIVDRLAVLTAGSVPGKLKMLFAGSPPAAPAPSAAKPKKTKAQKKKAEEPKQDPKAEPEKPAEKPKKDDEPDVEVDGPGSGDNQGKDGSGT